MSISANYPALRPALLLDFANSQQLDPRITFSRSTTAPYYDGKTSVKAEENLFVYAQDFRAATGWSLTNLASTTQSAGIAPDGTNTLNLITEDSSSNIHNINKSITGIAGAYTVSFYLQANTRTYGCVKISTDGGTNNYSVLVNLTTGAFVSTQTTGSPTGTSYSIVASGSAFRISVTATNTSGTVGGYAALSNSSTPTFSGALPTYTGDGTSSIYAWGAQLEQRSSVTAYNPTTTTALTNYIPQLLTAPINQPRFDFNPTTGESLGLLIEQSSTNLQPYSQDFSNAYWLKSNSSIISDTVIAPDGTQTVDKLVENSATSGHYVYSVNTLTAGSYTYSFYAKASGRFNLSIGRADSNINFFTHTFNLNTGTTSGGIITSVGNNMYRCSGTITVNTGATTGIIISMADGAGATTYAGNGFDGIFIWGAQLEALPFATSYIPTTSAQVTRGSDNESMTGTNFSSWYNQGQGTVYGECTSSSPSSADAVLFGGNSNGFQLRLAGLLPKTAIRAVVDLITTGTTLSNISTTGVKIAGFYQSGNNGATGNGNTPTTSTTTFTIVTPPTSVNIGSDALTGGTFINGRIKKISYYPQALTSAQLQALTGS